MRPSIYDRPKCSAFDRVDQCVAYGAWRPMVRGSTHRSARQPPRWAGPAASIERFIAPLGNEPVAPFADHVAIQFQPVGELALDPPSAAASMIPAHRAMPAALLRRRVPLYSSARSSSVNTIWASCGESITRTGKNPRINDSLR